MNGNNVLVHYIPIPGAVYRTPWTEEEAAVLAQPTGVNYRIYFFDSEE